ncbi:hypothetical protein [Enterobacter cloacae]|uniref:Uncharacterized protein n=1 Tax=Enterobacter cloacae TaxID=550 RepID=A0A157FXN5_ENTCL|nr:hypothetical protein [Enterobacter cloacae]CZV81790.1 Uncharacterised protein [Enterobacter cloacae]SAH28183.1 Uncharacterised protein [Enterobacter cloacae]
MTETEGLIITVAKQQVINFVAVVLCCVISYFSFKSFSYNDAKDILGALINISASIFTIVGLWVGFLYPNAMNSIVKDDVSYIKNEHDSPRIEKLVYTIITSACVMAGILIFFLVKAVFYALPVYQANKDLFKYIGIFFIYFISWMQLKCVMSLILSNLHFVNHLHGRLAKAKLEHYDE